jgi:tetratricopeptide (TPR) repeat protein
MQPHGKIGQMRTLAAVALLAVAVVASACAPKTVALPPPGAPHFAEYVQPTVPADMAASPAAAQNARAWQFLQAGDLRNAEREVALVLKAQPAFYPGQATAAYIALAHKDPKTAIAQFNHVTDAHPEYAPALVGKGLALVAADQTPEALDAFRAAVKADPSLTDVARRVDVLTLRSLQDELTAARQAARSGQSEAAIRAYRNAIAASPESAFLYRELAGIERQQGELAAAIEHLARANTLDPGDAASLESIGDMLEQQGDIDGAMKAYSEALSLEANPATEAKRAALRGRMELAALPEQYRAIENSAQITRAELAALIGVRLPALVQSAPVRDIGVLTDIRGQWAERWIAPVARAGIIEAFPNHTFQPRAAVRRVDLAQAVSRLLSLVASAQPARAQGWVGARGRFTDMTAGHLAYPAASMAVAAGVLQPTAEGAFQPTRVVTGVEAAAAIERVRALAGVVSTSASDRR